LHTPPYQGSRGNSATFVLDAVHGKRDQKAPFTFPEKDLIISYLIFCCEHVIEEFLASIPIV
jgi:hypothetical protein